MARCVRLAASDEAGVFEDARDELFVEEHGQSSVAAHVRVLVYFLSRCEVYLITCTIIGIRPFDVLLGVVPEQNQPVFF